MPTFEKFWYFCAPEGHQFSLDNSALRKVLSILVKRRQNSDTLPRSDLTDLLSIGFKETSACRGTIRHDQFDA